MRRAFSSMLPLLLLGGCAVLDHHVEDARAAYEASEYDDAEVWLAEVEDDVGEMRLELQARYYFLRGMTAYRKGRRDDALHYLALAREVVELGGALPGDDRPVLDRTLEELVPTTATWHARPPLEE